MECRFKLPLEILTFPFQESLTPSSETFPPLIFRLLPCVRFTLASFPIVPCETFSEALVVPSPMLSLPPEILSAVLFKSKSPVIVVFPPL